MNVIDSAKAQVKNLVEKVVDTATPDARSEAITIGRPRPRVAQFFADAHSLSQIFGDIAMVESVAPGRQLWRFGFGDDGTTWECVVSVEPDQVRFVDVNPQSATSITLDLRDAPGELGTAVIGRIAAPAPGILTGPLLYKALYRARALLLTGEIPTIRRNPAARDTPR